MKSGHIIVLMLVLMNSLWNIYLFLVDYAIYCDAGADP